MFADLAARLHRRGWRSLVPIVPGLKRPSIAAWQYLGARPPMSIEIDRMASLYGDHGVGFVYGGGEVVGIDIDILDPAAADEAVSVATGIMEATPLCRIGRPPKSLLLYRAAPNLAVNGKNFGGGLEVFFKSGQTVFFGTHPDTGHGYSWPQHSPLEIAPADLPVITAEMVDELVAWFSQRGGAAPHASDSRRVKPSKSAHLSRDGSSDRTSGNVARLLLQLRRSTDTLVDARKLVAVADVGSRYHTMLGCVISLVVLGFTDEEIIEALLYQYLEHFGSLEEGRRENGFLTGLRWARKEIGEDRFAAAKRLASDFGAAWLRWAPLR